MKRYDFIEIGTSDFDTIIQRPVAVGLRGLSVDPVHEYLERLPDLPNVKKVCGGISKVGGKSHVHYIDPEVFSANPSLPKWLKGCNCIGGPHVHALSEIQKLGLGEETFLKVEVRLLTFCDLVEEYEVGSVDCIKIDAEGMDLEIVESWLAACEEFPDRPGLFAEIVIMESNSFDRHRCPRFLELKSRLSNQGYGCHFITGNDVMFRKGRFI